MPKATDLALTFRIHRFGPSDPTMQVASDRLVWAFAGPSGPVTWAVTATDDRQIFKVMAWGDDADWALAQTPVWLGAEDNDEDFAPTHPTLRRLHRDLVGLRLGQSPSVFDMTVRMILQQRVAWRDAARSFRRLTLKYGEPAPGPYPVTAGLSAATWRRVPLPEFVAAGVEGKRARCVRDAAVSARRLEEIRTMARDDANRRLRAFPGIGVWTAQGVLGFALGDPDAVQEQDYDLPRLVSFALSGEPRADDARMLELLKPYAGHRFRVVRLLHESNIRTPRFGPRRARPQWERDVPRD